MKGYRKTVNHRTGKVRETYTNPITGTRHTYVRDRISVSSLLGSVGLRLNKKWLWAVLALVLIGGCGKAAKKPEAPAPEAKAVISTVPETTVPETTEATETTAPAMETTAQTEAATEPKGKTYVLNTSSKKIHKPGCSSVSKISDGNRQDVTDTIANLEAIGYSRCGSCKPS